VVSYEDKPLKPIARSEEDESNTFAARWWRAVSESNSWQIAAAVIIGGLTAVVSVVFRWAIGRTQQLFWLDIGRFLNIDELANYNIFATGIGGLPERWWIIPLVPMSGMLLLVILDHFFPGEIKGYGLPRFLEIVNIHGGYLRRRWITLKTISSAITLGSGMSAGIEGPVAQIGGSIGSTVGRALRPSFERLRVLIACGSASAIAASFSSPIAGVMFAQEIVLIGEFQAQAFYLIVLASGTATGVSGLLGDGHSVIHAPHFEYALNHELLFYVLMGLLAGILATIFIRSFYWIRDAFDKSIIPQRWLPVFGGLVVGVSLIFFPQIAASGYETMNAAFTGKLHVALLLTLVFMKIVMTCVTLSCGGSGGVFAPAMFIGAVWGGGFAALFNTVSPGLISEPGAFALIGMGAFRSAASHWPM
jgi:CIC family chloride channel protein